MTNAKAIKIIQDAVEQMKKNETPEILPSRELLGTFGKFWLFPRRVFNRTKNKKEWKWLSVKNVHCYKNFQYADFPESSDTYIEYFYEYEID